MISIQLVSDQRHCYS